MKSDIKTRRIRINKNHKLLKVGAGNDALGEYIEYMYYDPRKPPKLKLSGGF